MQLNPPLSVRFSIFPHVLLFSVIKICPGFEYRRGDDVALQALYSRQSILQARYLQ